MSDRFRPLELEVLTDWIADELDHKRSIFGIPLELAFIPAPDHVFRTEVYDQALETPLGVAAGPHSQLAQNIVAAWLCGARFIELKTVQTLDQLEVPKPCIDMRDEGYNVEWSQELTVDESFAEYLHAWVLIHALHHHLELPGESPGVIFNLSVGYDLEGIRRPNMQRYLDRVADAGPDLARCLDVVARRFPEVGRGGVPSRLSNSVTLSTMHGCPPDEIGSISDYLLRHRGLHTSVKLNPTLLGPESVRTILNDRLGFRHVHVPDEAFEHDLVYDQALALVGQLQRTAQSADRAFGVKLTNTLEVVATHQVFPPTEETMYLSGRPLHALTVTLAQRLRSDVSEPLLMSFSGGADAGNWTRLLRAGMRTVTVCSDLLKPGGYLRLRQYLENAEREIIDSGARSIEEFMGADPDGHLKLLAEAVADDPALHRDTFDRRQTKTTRDLGFFDCIEAPCTDCCDVSQKVPEYMRRVREGDLAGAAEVTRDDNPLASILGRACHHPCESVCLRTHMDQPVAIREIKRFITDHDPSVPHSARSVPNQAPVAIIGGGPCGLTAASFLARRGCPATVFESRPTSGGMVSATIPDYRAASHAIDRDLERVAALGVELRFNQQVGQTITIQSLRAEGFESLVVAAGAQRGLELGIDGEDADGVLDGLDFLRAARRGEPVALGDSVGVIGGGDVAMDCARSALRLGASTVTVFYRRTREEMPAQTEELEDLLVEGGRLEELAAPSRLVTEGSSLRAVVMQRMALGEADDSGRRRPTPVAGADFEAPIDTLIVAIGQRPDLGLFGGSPPALTARGSIEVDPETLETSIPGVYAGGDIIGSGPGSIVKAAGDGRRIADAILARRGGPAASTSRTSWPVFDMVRMRDRRARTEARVAIEHLPPSERDGFDEVIRTLSAEAARAEAARCLDCDLLCSTCDGVCPNRAILTYRAEPLQLPGFQVVQGPQVAVLADACNECGNCTTFCPTQGRPWRDKPRLYLHRADFEAETDNAFMLLECDGRRGIQGRFDGATEGLFETPEGYRYVTSSNDVIVDPEEMPESLNPHRIGAMLVLLRSFAASMPEFPWTKIEDEPGR
jgi:putative selenate reductase